MRVNHRLLSFVIALSVGVLANITSIAEASEKQRNHDSNQRHQDERRYHDRHDDRAGHHDHQRRHRLEHKHAKRDHHHPHPKRLYRAHEGHHDRHDHRFYSGFVLGSVVGHAFGGRDYIRHSDRVHFVRDYDGQCFRVEQYRYRDVWTEVPSFKCGPYRDRY